MSSTRCETVRSSRHRLYHLARSCCRWAPGSVRCCASTRASMRSCQHRAWPKRKLASSLDPSPQVAQISSARRRMCSTSAVEAASWWAAGVAPVSPWAPAATPKRGQRDSPSGSAPTADRARWAAAAPAASPVARRFSAEWQTCRWMRVPRSRPTGRGASAQESRTTARH